MDPGSVTPNLPAELYVSLFQQAADAMFVADPQGRLIAVNPRSCDILGFAAEEMTGRPFLDFTDPEDLRKNPLHLSELRSGKSVITERRLRCKDGRLIPVELTTRMLPDGHLLGVGRDLTERKRAEETLEIAHARLEALWSVSSLSEASPKAISDHILDSIVRMTHSPYGLYGFINEDESVMTIHARSGAAMQDCSLADRPQEVAISAAGVWGEAVRRRAPLIVNDYAAAHEGKKGLPEGHVPLTRLLVVPFFSRGRITAVAAVANRGTDYSQEDVIQLTSFLNNVETIADRTRAEEAREASEALLKATQRLSGIGGWEWDVERQAMTWTEETYRIHDLAPGDLAPGSREHLEKSMACYAPEARAAILEAFRCCAEQGTPYDLEVPFTSVTGRALWVRTRAEAVRRGDRIVKVIGDLMDITERKQAEEALQTSEERYRTLVEQASDGVVVVDAEGQCMSANQAFADMLGYSVRELSKLRFRDLVAEDGEPKVETVSAGTAPLREWSVSRKDGSTVPVEASVRALADGRRLAIVRDVTGRRLAERVLGEEALPYGAVVTGSDFRMQRVNSVFSTLLGYAPEELVGRSVAELTHPDDRDSSRELLARLKRREIEQFVIEKRYLTRSGEAVHAVTFVRGIYATGGVLVGTTAAVVDITDRARAETALRESEGRYRTLFEGASDAIFLMEGGRFVDCNECTLEVFGCAREEILSHHPADFSPSEQRDGSASGPRAEARIHAALAGEPQSFEWLHCRRDGTPFDAEVSLARVEWQGRVYLQAIVRDVTERRRAQEARLEMERRLLHAQKLESLGVLAGGIAHDFNNLLMAILGNLELGLRDLSPLSPVRPRLDAAGHAARRAADLTRQMLAYSGRGKFQVGRVDLNELVEENVHLLRTSIPRTVTLNLHLDRVLPAVEADAGQIQQVTMNLITNASEAIGGEPGVITLSTGVRDCDGSYLGRSCLDEIPPAGCFAYLEVTDSGCGMDEETQKRMFDPFFTTKFTGRGLGLPAVFGIVRGHGGAILLDSAAGKGTTIRVLFPAAGTAVGAVVPAVAAPSGVAEAAPSTGMGTILIVDDEEIVLQPCAAMVESMGFVVLTAADGEQAVEMVRRHGTSIRAIILDLTMPKLDGAAAFERILRIEPGAKVILSSGYDETEATGRVAKEQLAGFIRKPFGLEQLRDTLERVLGTAL
jgi:PAS domain S-box-containing protein